MNYKEMTMNELIKLQKEIWNRAETCLSIPPDYEMYKAVTDEISKRKEENKND